MNTIFLGKSFIPQPGMDRESHGRDSKHTTYLFF